MYIGLLVNEIPKVISNSPETVSASATHTERWLSTTSPTPRSFLCLPVIFT